MFGWFKKQGSQPAGPDFSQVDSQEKAVALFQQGLLEKLFLMPLEFGGEDNELNVLYVPIGVGDIKLSTDLNVIRPLIEAEKVSQYKCEPEYQGESFIPIAVKITAWNPGEFTTTINIWGEALGASDCGLLPCGGWGLIASVCGARYHGRAPLLPAFPSRRWFLP